jgi:DNA integrity scanning protein DisA with diadenylate cyclase activity
LAERTDALIAVVSEQTGEISLAQEGQLSSRLKPKELEEKMRKAYSG